MSGGQVDRLWMKSFAGAAFLMLVIMAALFGSAMTFRYWQAWVYCVVFLGAVLLVTVHFLRKNPQLVQRRISVGPISERRRRQKVLQALASALFVGIYVVSGLDRRFGWSRVPVEAALFGDALVAVGFAIVFLVFRENSHASATIEVSAGQRVISTGPYRHVRHPMYAGALLLLAATPVALGSLFTVPLVLPFLCVLVLRLRDEERMLCLELPGYAEYCREVRFRLIPRVY